MPARPLPSRAQRRARDLRVARVVSDNLPRLLDEAERVARDVDPGQHGCAPFIRDCRVAWQLAGIIDDLIVLPEPAESFDRLIAFPIALAAVGIHRAASRKPGKRDDKMAEKLAAMDLSAAERRAGSSE